MLKKCKFFEVLANFGQFCTQNAVKLKNARKCKIIFAPRVHEHVSEYIPKQDRQSFGTTSGLRYFTKIRTDNKVRRSSMLTPANGLATKKYEKPKCTKSQAANLCLNAEYQNYTIDTTDRLSGVQFR